MPTLILLGSDRPFKKQISSVLSVVPHSFCAMAERGRPDGPCTRAEPVEADVAAPEPSPRRPSHRAWTPPSSPARARGRTAASPRWTRGRLVTRLRRDALEFVHLGRRRVAAAHRADRKPSRLPADGRRLERPWRGREFGTTLGRADAPGSTLCASARSPRVARARPWSGPRRVRRGERHRRATAIGALGRLDLARDAGRLDLTGELLVRSSGGGIGGVVLPEEADEEDHDEEEDCDRGVTFVESHGWDGLASRPQADSCVS